MHVLKVYDTENDTSNYNLDPYSYSMPFLCVLTFSVAYWLERLLKIRIKLVSGNTNTIKLIIVAALLCTESSEPGHQTEWPCVSRM